MTRSTSRRQFLKGTLAATALAGFSYPLRSARAAGKDAYGGFLMGMQTYTFRNYSAEEALDKVRDLGLSTVEMFDAHFPSKSTPDQIAERKKQISSRGLTLLAHGVNPFSKDHAANKRWFEFAKAAGIRNLSANPSEDAFDSLDTLVAEYDVRIAIHNHGPGAEYDKVADVLNAIKGRHPNIGACADLGHYIRSGEDPVRAIHLLKGRLYGIHLKDFAEQKSETRGVILGQGHLDLVGVFKALREVDFPRDACLAVEYEEKPENPLEDVRACLAPASEGAQRATR